MNVLFIGSDPAIFQEGSGARARMRAYAAAVAETGGTLHILSRGSTTLRENDGSLQLHSIQCGKILSPFKLARAARQLITDEGISIVSAQDPFEHGWAALRAIRGTQAKLHIQVHTDFLSPWFMRGHIYRSPHVRMPLLNRVRQHIAARVLPNADGIRVVSERVKYSLMVAYGASLPEPSVIPIAVDRNVAAPVPLPPHPFTFALIAVGRLEPEKRIEDIIAAVHRLKDSYPSLGAFIVGEGRERPKLERMVRDLELDGRIIFLGARPDARGLMQSAQCFIQASAYEGYGLTLIEAALSRTPIITTDVGIVGEVFRGYEEVLAAPVADPTNLAAHIAWVIEDHEARKELAMAAEARALKHLAETDSSPRAIISDMARLV